MVLLREGLVKIDASYATLAALNCDRNVDASTVTALLDGFFERIFQMAQWPWKPAGDFEKAMVH